jgi:hypothetical protein
MDAALRWNELTGVSPYGLFVASKRAAFRRGRASIDFDICAEKPLNSDRFVA